MKQAVSEGDGYLADEGVTAMTLAEQLRVALLAQMGKTSAKTVTTKPNDKELLEAYMVEIGKAWDDRRMLDYFRKEWNGGVQLENGGIVCFKKPRINTEFCFHDEGPQYEHYKELMADKETRLRDYFLSRNLDDMDEEIRALECNCRFPSDEYHSHYYCKDWYLVRESYTGQTAPLNVWSFRALRSSDIEERPSFYGEAVRMSYADRQTILEGLKREREKFNKRLQTYLKRYGTSKIRTWTYWADA